MSRFESEGNDNIQKPAPKGESSKINEPAREHVPGTQVRSAKPEAVSKREEALFGKEGGFSFADHEDKSATAGSKAEKTKPETAKTADHARQGNKDAAGKSAPQELKGVDGMIDTARKYWQDTARDGKKEGGLSGHASAMAAEAMGLGVNAFESAHNLMEKVFPDGIAEPSRQYWQDMSKEGKAEGGVLGQTKNVTGKVMSGLVEFSNIGNMEKSFNKVVKDIDDVVPEDELKRDARSLGIDTLLTAVTFAPGLTGAKAMGEGKALFQTARAGTEIVGMTAAKAEVAGSVAGKLSKVAMETLPETGEALSKTSLKNFVGKLQGIAGEYGITLKKGGMIGECKGSIDAIEYSTVTGGPHEVAHLAHQLQTRVTALESQAAALGKNVSQLTKGERAMAYEKIVKPFEDVAYNQHEMWAGQAHAWGKTSAEYRDVLMSNWKSFEKGLTSGTVPEAIVDRASRAYGAMANWVGRSQLESAKNVGSVSAAIETRIRKD
jgi:hypothetical protein